MNTEEEFQEYKLQQLKRSRLTAVVLGMAAILLRSVPDLRIHPIH